MVLKYYGIKITFLKLFVIGLTYGNTFKTFVVLFLVVSFFLFMTQDNGKPFFFSWKKVKSVAIKLILALLFIILLI